MDAPQLQYAPITPEEKRRKAERWLIRLIILAVVAGALWKLGPVAWHRIQLLHYQRQSLSFSVPSDQIVCSNVFGDRQKLSKSGLYGKYTMDNEVIALADTPWRRFYELFSPPGRIPSATLFLHERRNGRGVRRLVIVEAFALPPGQTLTASVIVPGTVISEPQIALDGALFNLNQPVGPRFRYFAGQADPTDQTHFTIDFQSNDKTYTIDGYLRDDDAIDFSTREKK